MRFFDDSSAQRYPVITNGGPSFGLASDNTSCPPNAVLDVGPKETEPEPDPTITEETGDDFETEDNGDDQEDVAFNAIVEAHAHLFN